MRRFPARWGRLPARRSPNNAVISRFVSGGYMKMKQERRSKHYAFSLLELVIVVAIIAVLAAIAIPRMSRGSRGAGDAALTADLSVLRNAIDLFAAEHGGTYPTAVEQLTQYTDGAGNTQDTKDTTHIYGPYIRKIPPLPVGAKKGCTGISDMDGDGVGWLYDPDAGAIKANCEDSETDDAGKQYNQY
jgi:prepilin-type N-terminal cleavage/methylation domain-containing protein